MIEPLQINPQAIYDDDYLSTSLGISADALAKGRRTGALRSSRPGKRTLYLGQWILDWLGADYSIVTAKSNRVAELIERKHGGEALTLEERVELSKLQEWLGRNQNKA